MQVCRFDRDHGESGPREHPALVLGSGPRGRWRRLGSQEVLIVRSRKPYGLAALAAVLLVLIGPRVNAPRLCARSTPDRCGRHQQNDVGRRAVATADRGGRQAAVVLPPRLAGRTARC